MKFELKSSDAKKLALLFIATFLLVSMFLYNKKSVAQNATSSIPSSGSCALLMTLPIPYGFNVATNTNRNNVSGVYQTGYNFIGQLIFNSSTSGTFSGQIINATFNTHNSPSVDIDGGVENLQDFTVAIAPMTISNGFVGGYTFTFSGTKNNSPLVFQLVGVPSNSGNTIVMVSQSGPGPGSGICQV